MGTVGLGVVRTVVLTLHHPWGDESGGNLRTRALVGALAALGHDVTCIHPGPEGAPPDGVTDVGTGELPLGQRPGSEALRAVKRRYLPMPTGLGARDRKLGTALAGLAGADLLVVGEIGAVRYRRAADAARLWLDLPDLLSAAAGLHASGQSVLASRTALAQAKVLERGERLAAGGADVVTVAGWRDAQLLSRRLGRPVQWLPTPIAAVSGHVGEAPPRTAGFFGNFAHLPNRDAHEVLRHSWAPRLRDLGWDVVVAGHESAGLPASVHVDVLGPVPSPVDFYRRVGVTLAPLRLGGGMKVKVIESLLHGRPAVVTPHVLDGFPPELRHHLAVAAVERPDFGVLPSAVGREVTALLDAFSPARFVDTVGSSLEFVSRRASA